jgi:hypothetical protein
MKTLRDILNDFRQRENVDLYITIIVAVILSVLGMLGLATNTWLTNSTLAVLALLAFTNLLNRHKLEETLHQHTTSHFFIEEYPESVNYDIINAKELWLIGFHLARTITNYAQVLDEKLSRKERIKVLLIDPNSEAVQYIHASIRYAMTLDQFKGKILTSLTILAELGKKYPGRLEVRLIDFPLTFGTYSMNIKSPNGIMYIELYKYKTKGCEIRFVLHQKDARCYESYSGQVEELWQAGKVYDFSNN